MCTKTQKLNRSAQQVNFEIQALRNFHGGLQLGNQSFALMPWVVLIAMPFYSITRLRLSAGWREILTMQVGYQTGSVNQKSCLNHLKTAKLNKVFNSCTTAQVPQQKTSNHNSNHELGKERKIFKQKQKIHKNDNERSSLKRINKTVS